MRKGNTNSLKEPVVASFISDSAGNFMIHLPPGEYCIIDSRKYDKSFVADIAKDHKKGGEYYSAADLDCLKRWLNTPDAVFTVSANSENKIEVIYNTPCSWNSTPCINYSGPVPPAKSGGN